MLYDNALLARTYVRGWQLTGRDHYRTVAEETLDYLIRDMRQPEGGLYSAEDADSEGVEGKFYVWGWDELAAALGQELPLVAAAYGATPQGNFEGSNILHRVAVAADLADRFGDDETGIEARLAAARTRLFDVRTQRVRPGLDDKVIAAWNGLALRAFAEAGAVLGRSDYVEIAVGIAGFIDEHLVDEEGRLLRSWRDGVHSGPGFCDDYGAVAVGLFTLYQATGDLRWYREATRLTTEMVRLFADPAGGFFATGADAEQLITRPKNLLDNPTPSDNALAAEALLTLAAYTGDARFMEAVDAVGRAGALILERYPQAAGHLLAVLATRASGVDEIAVVGEDAHDLVAVVWETFRPGAVLAATTVPSEEIPLLAGRTAGPAGPLAYVCRDFACELPVATPDALRSQL